MDFSHLELDEGALAYPEVVPGRVLHIDADGIAYNSCPKLANRREVRYNLKSQVELLRKEAGAERVVMHLTGDASDKGKRLQYSTVWKYQGNRGDKPKPPLLHWARELVPRMFDTKIWVDREADDGLAYTVTKACAEDMDSAVLYSADKDLRTVPNILYLDPDTRQVVKVEGYGDGRKHPDKDKIIGNGTSVLWLQLLAGDSVDNIPGLDFIPGPVMFERFPTQPVIECRRRLREETMPAGKPCTEKQLNAAVEKLRLLKEKAKPGLCGLGTADKLLAECTSDAEAAAVVCELYCKRYGMEHTFTSWRGDEITRNWKEMLTEQVLLLFMRTSSSANPVDGLLFIKPFVISFEESLNA